ncbi:30S ribosomal protein S16 [Candidatus Gottesmanbacteria bacterium RIFCSPHIGHO2_02_FULL_39_14]|uniref:Small ribosomal subunit protein bS16 n=2 Tax=Candidatus Gottesmaniibacteriota TaxID=1752720 RepID=A0A1F5ZXI8_9BACT|nr:MAG: 30S ribosomal protein S16 [Candidatus Gottesmanbacteria bacterium RIFCSPHIGHO2_02_FULL_39_14]OGG31516.1 MAG: 30S ribosomal protein S16 [Candidatus Gottesmanbacteria bacterium RIFCSPLOWO2_02_FULL_38_8]
MALAIKLVKHGRKKRVSYRIVVAEKRSKITGSVVARLGFYDPNGKPNIVVNKEELNKWLSRGVHPTNSVKKLLNL